MFCCKFGFFKNNMESNVKYWIELSDYDFETAEAMLTSKRYLYVGFMCHQAIEKAFKAYYVKLKMESAPFSHSLAYLARKGGFIDSLSDEQKLIVDHIEPLNIEARYPSHKERLLKSLSHDKCIEIIKNTLELQKWIKERL